MNFLTPLAAFFAVLLPVVVLMYLLKLKRRRVVVPSTLLWRRSVQDLVANAPFQKLRNNLLLYVQLLILVLLILTAMRPTLRGRMAGSRSRSPRVPRHRRASQGSLKRSARPRTHTLPAFGARGTHLGIESPWENFFCAGDWVRHPNPSFFLERACATGIEAANRVISAMGLETFDLQNYPPPESFAAWIELMMMRGRRRRRQKQKR